MKKTKNIIKIILPLILLASVILRVSANTNIKIIGNSAVTVKSTITITFEGGENQSYSLNVDYDSSKLRFVSGASCNDNGSSLTCIINGNASGVDRISAVFEGVKAGTAKLVVTGSGSSLTDFTKFSVSASKTITVNEKTTTPPSTPSVDTGNKYPSTEDIKKQELALRKATPLVKLITIKSLSEKYLDEDLTSIKTVKDSFSYKYQLPKRIDKFEVVLETVNNDVKITGETIYQFESDEKSKTLSFTLSDGEIEQALTLQVDITPLNETVVTYEGNTYNLYDDELLDSYLAEFKFLKLTEIEGEPLANFYFQNNDDRLQLLVDADNKAHWFLLDENGFIKEEVVFFGLKGQGYLLLPIIELEEDRTIAGNKYQLMNLDLPNDLLSINSSLIFENKLWGWLYDDYYIVSALNSEGLELYALNNESYEKVLVAFDEEKNSIDPTLILAVTNALTLLAFGIYYFKNKSIKRKEVNSREIRKKLAK